MIDEGRDPWALLGVEEPSLWASWRKRIIGWKRRVDYNGLERAAIEAALSPTAGFHAAEAALFCARDVLDHFLGRRALASLNAGLFTRLARMTAPGLFRGEPVRIADMDKFNAKLRDSERGWSLAAGYNGGKDKFIAHVACETSREVAECDDVAIQAAAPTHSLVDFSDEHGTGCKLRGEGGRTLIYRPEGAAVRNSNGAEIKAGTRHSSVAHRISTPPDDYRRYDE